MEPEGSLPLLQVPATCPYQSISPGPRLSLQTVRNRICFYGEELLAPRPNPKLEDHPLSAVRDCLFNIFAATLHIGGRSSILNLRMRHDVLTEDPLTTDSSVYLNLWAFGQQTEKFQCYTFCKCLTVFCYAQRDTENESKLNTGKKW